MKLSFRLNSRRALKDVSEPTPYEGGSLGMSAVEFGRTPRLISMQRATHSFISQTDRMRSVKQDDLSGSICVHTRDILSTENALESGYREGTWRAKSSEERAPSPASVQYETESIPG